MKLLDCTLRDGGYYTNWDFEGGVVDTYIDAMNLLPIDYLEIGYRNNPSKDYMGKYGYSPVYELKKLREKCAKKIALMLNEKSTRPDHLEGLVKPIVGLVDMIRIAIDPKNFDRALELARAVKAYGFEVGFNCMYMSKWSTEYGGFLEKLGALDGNCDLFCMVDSFGGVTPEELKVIYGEVRHNTSVPIGFHGHNNLQLGLINTLTAIQLGVEYVDTTVLGMGRGAGNLNTELLLTFLNSRDGLSVDFNVLGKVVSVFTPLLQKYQWGTNLPYMIAGANGIPQKEVMDWVTNRVYSFNSIVRALDNRKSKVPDNAKYPEFQSAEKYQKVIVIGGGQSVIDHVDGIKAFIESQDDVALVFATARHAKLFADVAVPKYYVLVGSESQRLTQQLDGNKFSGTVILPPYPRTMGTEVPIFAQNRAFELSVITFIDEFKDSCTTIALQTALILGPTLVFTVGYDGYPGNILSEKEVSLTHENRIIFNAFTSDSGKRIVSLTPTLYKEQEVKSIYQFL